ncbi:MAG: Hpt domain-containing protein, partial [Isosphaeraceae bacterium]
MSGFDLSELLPYYLDETDEQIAGLNDALLKLERDPSDAAVLREAFRLIHSIKGASTVMGFGQVKDLTHHLETFFDRLRSGERTLDRPTLDLCFRCLDGLRDFHRELRSGNPPAVDLSSLTAEVVAALSGEPVAVEIPSTPKPPPTTTEPEPRAEPADVPLVETREAEPTSVESEPAPDWLEAVVPEGAVGVVRLTVIFAPNLPWPDMKAKLVMNRLASKARVLATEPPADQLESVETLAQFRLWLTSDCDASELRALADVEGVTETQIEAEELPSDLDVTAPTTQEAPPALTAEPIAEPTVAPDLESPAPSSPPSTPLTEEPSAAHPTPVAVKEKEKEPPAPAAKKVVETLRVDVDRLDSLMNLAGELVINRARFYEIAQGLEDLFRDSNARLLTADTQDRLDSLCHELEAFGGSPEAGERWVAQVRRLRDNFAEIRLELDLIRLGRERVNALSEAIHQLDRVTNGLQKGVLDTRMVPIGPLFDRVQRVIR